MKITKIEITQTKHAEALKFVCDELEKLISDDVVEIITNGNIATSLQDYSGYELPENKLEKTEDGIAKNYSLGKIFGKNLMVDPYMRWDDNRVLYKNTKNNIHEKGKMNEENTLHIIEILDENMMLI